MTFITRRAFLRDLGRGTVAIAILGFGAAACAGGDGDSAVAGTSSSTGSPDPSSTGGSPVPPESSTTTPSPDGAEEILAWERVVLGNVSAYLLVRRGEVAIVDTGNPGSAATIESSLTAVGADWEAVSHVILTHLHGDHVGSLGDVMAAAPEAAGFAGAPDIPSIASPRPLTPLGDGDSIFGLDIIATPGHTPGSISVLDRDAGVLVAGDALNGVDGGVGGANPRFSSDMAMADESVRKIAGFEFDTALFGHGDPVVGGAGALVRDLAETL